MTLDFSVSSHCCTPDSFATDGAIRILCLHYIAFTLVCVVKYVCALVCDVKYVLCIGV